MATKEKAPGTAVAKAKVNLPVDISTLRAAEIAEIQKRIGSSAGDKIGVTTLKTLKLPNGIEVDEMECVIVEFIAENKYYVQGYQKDNVIPPVCFALNFEPAGMVPSENSPDVQGGSCAACWANQFKSAANGKGKACSNYRKMAILPTDGDADTPLAHISASSTATKYFDAYVGMVAQRYGVPLREVVTKIFFSSNDFPSLRFECMGPAPKDLISIAWSQKDAARTMLSVEPNVTAANDDDVDKKPAAKSVPKKVINARR